MTDFREGGPLWPPHPWAAPKKPILNRVNDFLQFNITWMVGVFLFSSSLWPDAQKSSTAIELMNFMWGHVCVTAVKMSCVFYLHLLWCKSLFQVVTECTNNYHFLKICSLNRPLLIKHLFVNKISENTVLTTWDTLNYNE